MRVAPTIELTDVTRKALEKAANSNTQSVRFARRARIVLLASQGMTNQEIAQTLGIGALVRWRQWRTQVRPRSVGFGGLTG